MQFYTTVELGAFRLDVAFALPNGKKCTLYRPWAELAQWQ